MSPVILLVLAVASLALGEAAFHWVRYRAERGDEELRRRLRLVGEPDAGLQLLRRRRLSDTARLDSLLGTSTLALRIERLLEQTDLAWTVATFCAWTLAAGLCGLCAGFALLRNPLVGLLLSAVAAALPLGRVLEARSRRRRRISDQLPDALEMMARSLRAGHALSAAFKLVATEAPAPVAVEFGKAFEQQNLGLPLDQAVVSMAERVPGNADLRIFAVSVLVQHETGGNLVEVLEKIAETIRERYRFYGKLRALTAEGRLGGLILGGLPFVVAALLCVVNPDYMSELASGTGRMIVVGGTLSWLGGVTWMYRIAQVEY